MVHIDKGANQKATKYFFDRLNTYGIKFDVIGQSYYPWWHGTMDELRQNLAFMATEYQKDIIVVEAAYNWRPAEYRDKEAPFPETPEGQRQFLDEVNRQFAQRPTTAGKAFSGGNRRCPRTK
jgi:arabinogalactan endo-1,4-beta-galactosidase